MAMKFGVKSFLDQIDIEPFDKENIYISPEYQYIVEIVDGIDNNGNGTDKMNIYSNGKLETLSVGNWKISPIVKMPYNWSGFSVQIDICDSNSETILINHKPTTESMFKKVDFIPDVKYVFETFNRLILIQDKKHYELMEQIKLVDKEYNFHKNLLRTNEIKIGDLIKICKMIEVLTQDFKDQRDRIKPEYHENIKKEINRLMLTITDFKIKLLE